MDENMRIVEIKGVKIQVDLRQCKVIEEYKVGDQIKVLLKKYSDTYESYPGVIVGFDDFPTLPSINIAYLKSDYSGAEVEFLTFNSQTKDVQIAPLNTLDRYFSKTDAIEKLDKKIEKLESEIAELKDKKKYFESTFHKYFEEVKV